MATCSIAFLTRRFLTSVSVVFFARFKFLAARSVRASFFNWFSRLNLADFIVACFSMDLAILFAFAISVEFSEDCLTDFASIRTIETTAATWDGVFACARRIKYPVSFMLR